ncbi:SDR family NAD(P)-dependent oxidoreductase [Chitinophagaceae bacterium LWZ2-11]
MASLHFENKWVLITGASSGLGHEMALQLAIVHKANVILVARRVEKLLQLKETIETQSTSKVKTITADLSNLNDIDKVLTEVLADNNLYAAILNAGVTFFGSHLQLEWDVFAMMLQTNVTGMVKMTTELTRYFEKTQQPGGIMVVSSMAAVLPTPYQAAYAGTKGFMLNFITALSHEVSNKNLSYTVYLPGGMQTEMTDNDKFSPLKNWLMPVQTAAAKGINAFIKRKATFVPGAMNKFGAIISGIVPKHLIVKSMAKTYGKALKNK